MDNEKDDAYYLSKIMTDLEFLIKHTSGKRENEIINDEVLLDSIMFRLIQISENGDKLSGAIKERNKSLPWREIKGMRNRIVHDYAIVDTTIIYNTVSQDIPKMYKALKEIA